MLYLTIILFTFIVILLIRLLYVKKEIKRVTKQLENYNNRMIDKKIEVGLYDKHIEALAIQINNQIDLGIKVKMDKINTENEIQQAIANMSHDLRTPLTSILGYIQLLKSDNLILEERQTYVAIAENRAKRLHSLVNDFFELSVVDSVDYGLVLNSLTINNLILEILISFYDSFNEKNIKPIINIPDENIIIVANMSAVKRVIENLISNAIKYSRNNVLITLEKQEFSAILTISNSTDDLTQNDVNRLFDKFYRADKTRSGQGAGLGLYIAKSLMYKMNGALWAELQQGHLHIKCKWKLN
ncbi:sensor histidine kinase [Bacillus paramycoides]|uniref:sensor histidine kinase n=1 Tax=Bacillus paramycoides TaxID=2026194 RepID=UPI003D013749